MYVVDITADLNDEDDTGYVWAFLDEAPDTAQVVPGAIVVAGDEDATAVRQVVDLVPAGDGVIVHLRILPALVEQYFDFSSAQLADGARATFLHTTTARNRRG